MSQISGRLKHCLDTIGVDAKALHDKTGLGLRTCYRIFEPKSIVSIETIKTIKNHFPILSLSYIIVGIPEPEEC